MKSRRSPLQRKPLVHTYRHRVDWAEIVSDEEEDEPVEQVEEGAGPKTEERKAEVAQKFEGEDYKYAWLFIG